MKFITRRSKSMTQTRFFFPGSICQFPSTGDILSSHAGQWCTYAACDKYLLQKQIESAPTIQPKVWCKQGRKKRQWVRIATKLSIEPKFIFQPTTVTGLVLHDSLTTLPNLSVVGARQTYYHVIFCDDQSLSTFHQLFPSTLRNSLKKTAYMLFHTNSTAGEAFVDQSLSDCASNWIAFQLKSARFSGQGIVHMRFVQQISHWIQCIWIIRVKIFQMLYQQLEAYIHI